MPSRGKAGKRGALPQLDMDLREFGDDPGITNAHDASDAPFQQNHEFIACPADVARADG